MNFKGFSQRMQKTNHAQNLLLDLSADSQTLTVLLYPEEKTNFHYQMTLKNSSLPQNILLLLGNVKNVHECLQDLQNISIDQNKGIIKMNICIMIRGKQIKNECILELEKVESTSSPQAHMIEINALKKLINQLKSQNQDLTKRFQHRVLRLEQNFEVYKNNSKKEIQNQRNIHQQRMQEMLMKYSKEFDEKIKAQHDSFIMMIKNIKMIHDQQIKELKDKISQLGNKTQIQQNKLNNLLQETLNKDKLIDEIQREKKQEAQAQDIERQRRAQLREEARKEDERVRIEREKKEKLMRAREQEIKKMKTNLEANKASMNKLGENKKYSSGDRSGEKVECKQQ